MAALPLLGSTDEDEDAAGPLAADMSGQRSVVGGNHAIVNDPTEVDGDLGVTVTSAAPSNGAVTPGTGAFGISLHERISLCFTCRQRAIIKLAGCTVPPCFSFYKWCAGYSTSVAELLGQQPVVEEPGLPLATAQVGAERCSQGI